MDGVNYSGHAFDQMQADGIMPTVVKDTIDNIKPIDGKKTGTSAYYNPNNDLTVITDSVTGNVITVSRGQIKQ